MGASEKWASKGSGGSPGSGGGQRGRSWRWPDRSQLWPGQGLANGSPHSRPQPSRLHRAWIAEAETWISRNERFVRASRKGLELRQEACTRCSGQGDADGCLRGRADAESQCAAGNDVAQRTRPAGVDFEVIVVDEASTDDTLRVIASLGDSRIRVIRHSRAQGVSAARNRGVAEARGAWIAFLDDDDLWAPTNWRSSSVPPVRAGHRGCTSGTSTSTGGDVVAFLQSLGNSFHWQPVLLGAVDVSVVASDAQRGFAGGEPVDQLALVAADDDLRVAVEFVHELRAEEFILVDVPERVTRYSGDRRIVADEFALPFRIDQIRPGPDLVGFDLAGVVGNVEAAMALEDKRMARFRVDEAMLALERLRLVFDFRQDECRRHRRQRFRRIEHRDMRALAGDVEIGLVLAGAPFGHQARGQRRTAGTVDHI